MRGRTGGRSGGSDGGWVAIGLTVVAVMTALVALGWVMGSRLRGAAASGATGPDGAVSSMPPTPPPTRRGVVSVFRPSTTTTTTAPWVAAIPDPVGRALMVDVPAPTTSTTAPVATTTTSSPPATTAAPRVTKVTGVGDSIMLGAAARLAAAVDARLGVPIEIDARVGRPFAEGVDVVNELAAAGTVGEEIVVHLGTNGPITAEMVREVLDQFRTARRVVLVNVRVPRDYEGPVNETLAAVGAEYPNVRLVDWYSATEGRQDLFWADGVHLRADGSAFYADLIAEALAA